jgi:Undecaprenyl-phosphate glucose phosphotransferase
MAKTSIQYSRLWLVLWFVSAALLLILSRALMRAQIRRWTALGRLSRSVAIVGTGAAAQRVLRHFGANPESEVHIAGLFSDRKGDAHGASDLESLAHLVRRDVIDTIIVAIPPSEEGRLLRILGQLRDLPVDVLYFPGGLGAPFANLRHRYVDGLSVLTVFRRPLTDWRLIVKELEDRVLAIVILTLIAPVMLGIAFLIKLESPGPVFFRQRRYGFNNQYIEVFKFRTMYDDRSDPNAEQLTRRNDPRITRLGAYLRKWSLDELPQFINVLRGEMSIVGPRPHALSAKAAGRLYQEAVRQYSARHRVKPGITGWAQVNGWRGETDTLEQIRKRVEHDLVYIDNWSLWFDIRIILLTMLKGFTGKNAF